MKQINIDIPKGFYFDEERSNIVISRIEKSEPAKDKAFQLVQSVLMRESDRIDYPTAKSIAYLLVDNIIDALVNADVKGKNLYYWSDVKHNIAKL